MILIASIFIKKFTLIGILIIGITASQTLIEGICHASDLDDGITADDPISKYDAIKVELNRSFIKRDAKARAKMKKRDENNMSRTSDAVQGGVIVKPGGEIGDVIIIYEGQDNTVISGD
jgi:hypothetical protein